MLIEQGPRGDRSDRPERGRPDSWTRISASARPAPGCNTNSASRSIRPRWPGSTPTAFKRLVREKAAEAYDERETEYPVMAGLYHFTTQDANGQKRVDREQLVAWARERFDVDLNLDDLKNRQRDEIRGLLVEHSRALQKQANAALAEVASAGRQAVQRAPRPAKRPAWPAAATARSTSLSDWLRQSLHCELPTEKLARLNREQLERRLEMAVEDRYRPEMRRMERSLVLQILDTAWKDHLLAMDHLRASVGLARLRPGRSQGRVQARGHADLRADVDVGRRARDRSDFSHGAARRVGRFAPGSKARRFTKKLPRATDIAGQQQAAIDGTQADQQAGADPQPQRERVGRNDPCPCGSGKKFKNCCMRKGRHTAVSVDGSRTIGSRQWPRDVHGRRFDRGGKGVPAMAYLLNLLYRCCSSSARPGCCAGACARENIARAWGQKLLGLVPAPRFAAPLRVAARRQHGRSQPDRAVGRRDSRAGIRTGTSRSRPPR